MDIALIITGIWCIITIFYTAKDCHQISQTNDEKLLEKKRSFESYATNLSIGGVLGTFLGISYGLWDFDSENLDTSVPQLLDGLKFAFGTSIIGMFCSYIVNKQINKAFDKLGQTDITAALNLSKTVEKLKNAIENNSTKVLNDTMGQIANTFEKEMEKVSTKMESLMQNLVNQNFDELNSSIKNLNAWQQENLSMITKLTIDYNTAVENFKLSSTALENMTAKTGELIGKEGELTILIKNLHTAMIEDKNFVTIATNVSDAALNLKRNATDWETSVSNLKAWIASQQGLSEKVAILTNKLEEVAKQKDYNEEFWKTTRKGMNDATGIISKASSDLKDELQGLDKQFYERLNATLTNLDRCITKFMKG